MAAAVRTPSVARSSDRSISRRSCRTSQSELLATTDELDLRTAQQTLPSPSADHTPVDLDVWTLHVRYARTREPEVRNELVNSYSRYAISLAQRLHRDGEPLDDLIQVAMEALLLAIDRFDPARSLPFPAFATPTIIGSLKRHYRDLGWGMRVPRRIHEIAAPVRETVDRLTVQLGRSPVVSEVAEALGLSEEQVLDAQEAAYTRSMTSLDAPLTTDGSRLDVVGELDAQFNRFENHMALGQALEELSEREREILRLYYVEELNQTEIGQRYGVSQMQVSRWLSGAVRRLRGHIVPPGSVA